MMSMMFEIFYLILKIMLGRLLYNFTKKVKYFQHLNKQLKLNIMLGTYAINLYFFRSYNKIFTVFIWSKLVVMR